MLSSRRKARSPQQRRKHLLTKRSFAGHKLELYEARELKLKQWNAEREAALEQVRQTTQERIRAARQGIDQSVVDARTQIESVSGELSSRVLAAVLPAGVSATEAAR